MKGEELTKKEIKVLRFLRNQLIQYGKSPSIREIMEHLGYQSPRAAAYILEKLKAKGFVDRGKRGRLQIKRDIPNSDMHAQTIEVPLVGSAPCGTPAFAEDNIEAWISVSDKLAKRPHRYFLLRANGDSMDLAGIHDQNLVLVRQQSIADNGDIIVALIDGEATIKKLRMSEQCIILEPQSKSSSHKPIFLQREFLIQGIVVDIISY